MTRLSNFLLLLSLGLLAMTTYVDAAKKKNKHKYASSSSSSSSSSSGSTSGSSSSSSNWGSWSSGDTSNSRHGHGRVRGVHTHCVRRGKLALTFKGKLSKATYVIAKKIEDYDATATFYVNGRELTSRAGHRHARLARKLISRLISKRHTIGVAPWNESVSWKKQKAKRVLRSVNRSAYYLQKVLGVRPNFVHPPLGQTTRSVVRLLRHHGYHIIKWNTTLEKQGTKIPKFKDHGSAKKNSFIAYQHADKGTAKEERQVLKSIEKKDYDLVSLRQCLGDIKPYLDARAAVDE